MAIQSKRVLIIMPGLFTEDTDEQAIIELFENMCYDHLYAPDMDRDYNSPLGKETQQLHRFDFYVGITIIVETNKKVELFP